MMKQCARAVFNRYPWWCTRLIDHDGPCALKKRWFYWFLEK